MRNYLSILLFCSLFGFSQTEDIAKRIEKLKTQKEDSAKVNNLNSIAYKYRENDNIKALEYSKKALELAQKINFENGIWFALNNHGEAEKYLGHTEEAIVWHQKGLDFATAHSMVLLKAHSLSNLATLLKNTKNFAKAEEYFLLALDGYTKAGFKQGHFTIYNNMGNMFADQAKFIDAYRSAYRAYEVAKEIKEKPFLLCQSLNSLGSRLYELNKKDSSRLLYEQAYALSEKHASKREIVNSGSNLAYMYSEGGEYKRAEDLYKKMLMIARGMGDLYELGMIYGYMDEMFYASGNYKLAHDYQDSAKRINREILNSENIKSINNLTALYENEKKELQISNLSKENEVQEERLKRENVFKIVFAIGFVLIGLFAVFLFYSLREKEKARKIIDKQKMVVEEKQKEILDSIHYAKRIQHTLLAHESLLKKNLKEHFVLYQPKDIVSGDFYWATETKNKFYLAVCDSTGHGVPGAFMSLLNSSFLNEAINEKNISNPAEVFNYVRRKLIESMSVEEQKDGMDGTLICFEKNSLKMTYASANNKLLVSSHGNLIELGCDKMPIGKGEKTEDFKSYSYEFKQQDVLYLFTDGYADQFGGPKGKKYKYKHLNELINSVADKPLNEQVGKLLAEFKTWKGNLEQVDDVTLVGIRI